MEWRIPYFEYDVFARIAPGAATVAVARWLGMPSPFYWEPLLPIPLGTAEAAMTGAGSAPAATLDTGVVLYGGLTLLAAAYVVGTLYEAFGSLLWRSLSPRVLRRAARERKTWLHRVPPGTPPLVGDDRDLFKLLLQWLLTDPRAEVRGAFAHIHRFQAEARMFAYSTVPLAALALFALVRHAGVPAGAAAALGLLTAWCGYLREHRRWVQALATLDQLRPADDPGLASLQRRFEELGGK